jgi:hypothetical protein
MKELKSIELELFSAGGFIDGFCNGFGIVVATHSIGVVANLWNPVGQTTAIAIGVIGVGCAVNAIL